MKNLQAYLLVLFLLATINPAAASSEKVEPKTETSDAVRAQQLLNRLQEIDAMDKTNLTRSEKKALRKEVKEIKKEMKAVGGGVYLSAGAIIIIILLLILLL